MSLRARFLALFAALAVVPLIAIGIFNYIQSLRALEDLVAGQVGEIAQRAATELSDRFGLRESDLLLLAETQRLYRVNSGREPGDSDAALSAADAYLNQAWQLFASSYAWIEFRDLAGGTLYRLGNENGPGLSRQATPGSSWISSPSPGRSAITTRHSEWERSWRPSISTRFFRAKR